MRSIAMRLLLLTLLTSCLTGCGLFSGDSLDFREYPLREVGYSDAFDMVHEVTRDFYSENLAILGGFDVAADKQTGLIKVRPVVDGNRRMTLYMTLEPRNWGTAVAMLALVEHLDDGSVGAVAWSRPLSDVSFEELLYRAFLEETIRRREG
ncbi:MAG: hypothetical protein ACI9EF_002119 [Pseudohongiellaceae bacterium]|jgi:hypothetical protein